MNKIKISITDDHKIFREGLKTALSVCPDFEIVLESDNGEELLQNYPRVRPDIFLMDINMPKLDGISTTKQLKQALPDARIIALSVSNQELYVSKMFDAGAKGYILKDADPEEIIKAIQMVYHGEYYFADNLSVTLFKKLVNNNHPVFSLPVADGADLNKTEINILELICKEHTTQEIGDILSLSAKTIENYRVKMLAKTRSKNTAGLVIYAIQKGYVIL